MNKLSALALGAAMSASVAAQEVSTAQTLEEQVAISMLPQEYSIRSLNRVGSQERTSLDNLQPSSRACLGNLSYCSPLREERIDTELNLSFPTNTLFLGFLDASYDPQTYKLKVNARRCFNEDSCVSLGRERFYSDPLRERDEVHPGLKKLYGRSWTLSWRYRF